MGLKPVFMSNALKGMNYLKEYPESRTEDLKDAFQDLTIKGIFCAIGGEDTYCLVPYLLEDKEFVKKVNIQLNCSQVFLIQRLISCCFINWG